MLEHIFLLVGMAASRGMAMSAWLHQGHGYQALPTLWTVRCSSWLPACVKDLLFRPLAQDRIHVLPRGTHNQHVPLYPGSEMLQIMSVCQFQGLQVAQGFLLEGTCNFTGRLCKASRARLRLQKPSKRDLPQMAALETVGQTKLFAPQVHRLHTAQGSHIETVCNFTGALEDQQSLP